MKALRLELSYLLPDDFGGSLADALRHLADFCELDQEPPDATTLGYTTSWDTFRWNVRCGARLTGKARVDSLEPEGWRIIPDGVVRALRDGHALVK